MGRPSNTRHRHQADLDLAEHTLRQLPGLVARSGWTAPTELPDLRGVKRIGLDIETCDPELQEQGPGFRRGAYPVGLSIAIEDVGSWYLPVRHQGGGNLDENLIKRWAREELGQFKGEVVGANLGYDLDGLATCWDVHFPRETVFHDVLVAEPMIDEWKKPGSYNLESIAQEYLGEGKDEALLKEAAAFYGAKTPKAIKQVLWRLPAEVVGPYAEADAALPLAIWERQRQTLVDEELWDAYELTERPLIPILVAMRRRGVRVNAVKAEALLVRMRRERDKWVAKLKDLAGPAAELLDPASLGPALEERGIHVPRTPTGKYSVTKPLLQAYAQDELVLTLLAGRKVNTIITTFLESQILGYAIKGRIHPTFHQLKSDDGGTIGRFSGANPNLQFIPAREDDWQEEIGLGDLAPLIRSVFEPEEGEDWQRDDASQIEYRFLAHYAVGQGAEEARAAYNSDPKTDFHKMCASMLGVDPEDKVRRKRVKNTNFCKVYGGGIPKIASTFNCSEEEAGEFVKFYDSNLPFVESTYQAAMKWAERRGFVVTIMNRKQRFPFWEPYGNYKGSAGYTQPLLYEDAVRAYGSRIKRAFTYTALNKKLQISAAEAMKKWMIDAWNAGICDVIGPYKLTVHDELGNSIPRTKAGDEAGRELTAIGERAVQLKVPLLIESERGEDWGACS